MMLPPRRHPASLPTATSRAMITAVPQHFPDLTESMMAIHRGLDQILQAHRLALMTDDLPEARSQFARYAKALRAHAKDEEELILPVFAARGGEDLDSPPRLFLGEHDKIREFLAEAEALLAGLEDGDRQAALDLLDRQVWFMNLLVHHDIREGKVLYPRVQEWTTQAERAAILSRLRLPEAPR